jgi:hypothetical protein
LGQGGAKNGFCRVFRLADGCPKQINGKSRKAEPHGGDAFVWFFIGSNVNKVLQIIAEFAIID